MIQFVQECKNPQATAVVGGMGYIQIKSRQHNSAA